jgi:hypothetical protein
MQKKLFEEKEFPRIPDKQECIFFRAVDVALRSSSAWMTRRHSLLWVKYSGTVS